MGEQHAVCVSKAVALTGGRYDTGDALPGGGVKEPDTERLGGVRIPGELRLTVGLGIDSCVREILVRVVYVLGFADTGEYKVIHCHTAVVIGTSGKAEGNVLYAVRQVIQGEYHVLVSSSLRQCIQGDESRSVCRVGHIADYQRAVRLAGIGGTIVKRQLAGVESLRVEERKRKYLSGSGATSARGEVLLSGRFLITVAVVLFLSYDGYCRSRGGNSPALRCYVACRRTTGCVAGEGLNPGHVQTGTSRLEGSSYGLAHFRCGTIGAHVEIVFLLLIETGNGYGFLRRSCSSRPVGQVAFELDAVLVLRSFAFPRNSSSCIRNLFYSNRGRRSAGLADGLRSTACQHKGNFRLFLLTGGSTIGVLNQVIRIRRIERKCSCGAYSGDFHLNKQVAALVGVRGVEINGQFAIRYSEFTFVHCGERASFRGSSIGTFFIFEEGVIRLGERYFELSLSP